MPPGHLPSLVNAIRPAVYDAIAGSPDELLVAATARNAKNNAARAESDGPILSERHGSGKLSSATDVYEISTGQVTFL